MDSRELRRRRRIKKQKQRRRLGCAVLIILMLCVVGAGGLLILTGGHGSDKPGKLSTDTLAHEPKTVTISSVGDVILHDPFIRSTKFKNSDGSYDFSSCFETMKPAFEQPDCMVANLETTFAGKDAGYTGYPTFNSPEVLVDNMTANGIDVFLTANNHIYDKGANGLVNTAKTLEEKGVDFTGIRTSTDNKKYLIKDVNGIKVGFLNYVFETPRSGGKALNSIPVDGSVADLVNSFDPSNPEPFYEEIGKQMALMRLEGAEFIIVYPHWGEEYKLEAWPYTVTMAQKICDLGADAIIGGHPHVVEPVDVLEAADGSHKTFVAYSMGNHLSNQRRELISSFPTGHTEDGLMVSLTISRDESGAVTITGIDCQPTWVYKSGSQQNPAYQPVLCDDSNMLKSIGNGIEGSAKASSERTHKIIDAGLKKAKEAYGVE